MIRPNHLRAVPRRDVHPVECTCPACEPYVPSQSSFAQAATQTWALLAIGMVVGTLLVFAVAGVAPTLRAFVGS